MPSQKRDKGKNQAVANGTSTSEGKSVAKSSAKPQAKTTTKKSEPKAKPATQATPSKAKSATKGSSGSGGTNALSKGDSGSKVCANLNGSVKSKPQCTAKLSATTNSKAFPTGNSASRAKNDTVKKSSVNGSSDSQAKAAAKILTAQNKVINKESSIGKPKNAEEDSSVPRFGPDFRLLRRFYEPLAVLEALDRSGERSSPRDLPFNFNNPQDLRREFTKQLAYVCDFEKGGDTVTSIFLEACPSGIIFHISANRSPTEAVKAFVCELLSHLRDEPPEHPEKKESWTMNLVRRCVEFNKKRLETYWCFIQKPLQACIQTFQASEATNHKLLVPWLQKFLHPRDAIFNLCCAAHEERHSVEMKLLQEYIGNTLHNRLGHDTSGISSLRHYLGRLGSHLKAVKIFALAAKYLPWLFENPTVLLHASPNIGPMPRLYTKSTTLPMILTRMFPNNCPDLLAYQESLTLMDRKFDLLDKVTKNLREKASNPRVHAEIILAEYAHRNGIPFVDNDRFIGCSKPACYCCDLYFQFHPGGLVRPDTHGVRYMKWAPHPFVDADNADERMHRLGILNKMNQRIRQDALQQIRDRRGPSAWHPDSTTGISLSLPGGGISMGFGGRAMRQDWASDLDDTPGPSSYAFENVIPDDSIPEYLEDDNHSGRAPLYPESTDNMSTSSESLDEIYDAYFQGEFHFEEGEEEEEEEEEKGRRK